MENSPKLAIKFNCEICNYKCSKESDYRKHLQTRKHTKLINVNLQLIQKIPLIQKFQLIQKSQIFICAICHKEYKSNVGLWKHKKKCKNITPNHITPNKDDNHITTTQNENVIIKDLDIKTLIIELVKSNTELHKQMVEVCKNSNNNSHNNSNNNSNSHNNNHNKTFNLQVFLNEDCKDAMNLSEFVNSLQLQLSDLDNMGKLGYTEGISKIILTEMNDLEQTKRPVHCSDIKRETLYVKDEDKWEKEQPDHPKLNKAIRKIEQKNFGLMGEWQAEHPSYKESTSEENNEFLKLISQTVNGTPDNINKVIKKIAKEVVIDK